MVQIIISGLARGSVYSLIGLAYYIIYETTNLLNFAMGELVMVGAMVNFTIFTVAGIPFYISLPCAMMIAALLGALIERMAIRPLKTFTGAGYIMSTIGAGMIFKNIAILIWGGGEQYTNSMFGTNIIKIFGAGILPQEIANFVICIFVAVCLLVFLKKSLLGKGLRAVAFNKQAAGLMGINVKNMVVFAYMLSAALAALAGVLISPVTYASASMGTIGQKAFCAAIVGGLKNPTGILLGGLILGIVEFLFSAWAGAAMREASSFILIMLILAIKPTGLFSEKVVDKV